MKRSVILSALSFLVLSTTAFAGNGGMDDNGVNDTGVQCDWVVGECSPIPVPADWANKTIEVSTKQDINAGTMVVEICLPKITFGSYYSVRGRVQYYGYDQDLPAVSSKHSASTAFKPEVTSSVAFMEIDGNGQLVESPNAPWPVSQVEEVSCANPWRQNIIYFPGNVFTLMYAPAR